MQKEEKMKKFTKNTSLGKSWKRSFGKKAALGLSLLMLAGVLGGCGDSNAASQSLEASQTTEVSQTAESQSTETSQSTESNQAAESSQTVIDREGVTVRVGSLKGPTSLGLLYLMDKAAKEETVDTYEFQMAAGADELLPLMIKGELDIALIPANAAANLYQKTEGGVEVIDINTLGVLYLVTGTAKVAQPADLKGQTIYLTGKGATPEAALRYVLAANGLTEEDYTLEFKSEATEVAAVLAENPDAVGLLPQPFVTAACMQNEALQVVMDLNQEWADLQEDNSGMVTGVTVVRKAFLEENPQAAAAFLEEHAASAAAINEDPKTGAALAVEAGIVAKEPIAEKAIPQCNITCITGEEMKAALSAYLGVLNEFDANLIGGTLPADDFYFLAQ